MIRILELTWLFMSLLGAGGIIYKLIEKEDSVIGFFIFTSVAAIMYFYRRRQRIMMDKARIEDTTDKYH